jgi:hypothetical protein
MHFSPAYPQVPTWLAALTTTVAYRLPWPGRLVRLLLSPATCWRLAKTFLTLSKLSKGAHTMNALQLIPVAVSLGEDALKLTQGLESSNKDETVAAVVAAAPVLAELFNQPELTALLTAERVAAAFDFVIAGDKIVAALGLHLPAPTETPAEQPAA